MALALIHLPLPVGALTLHVPSEYPTIQAGIDAASPGDIVLVACGTYYEHSIQMASGIELRSQTGEANCVTIDVAGNPVGIWCHALTQPIRIVGFTITGASGNALGFNSSEVTLENCRFWRNVVTDPAYSGAAVACDNNLMGPFLISCRFDENVSLSAGGGLNSSGSDPILTDCVFERNFAPWGGGGAKFVHGFPTLVRCSFIGDSTSAYGGGVAFAQATVTFRDCDFRGCWADSGGGGLHSSYGTALVSGCLFEGNRTWYGGGGGAAFLESYAFVDHSAFTANSSNAQGGGVDCSLSFPSIEHCTFTGNSAKTPGGGAAFSLSALTMVDCTFTGNSSVTESGGGVNANSTTGTVDSCSFAGNSASVAGGGFHIANSPMNATNSIFEDNSASRGGGLSLGASQSLVDGCTFRRNHATLNGGGLTTSFRDPTVRNCAFEGNSADVRGGGLSCFRSWPQVSGSVFAGNTSAGVGGGISGSTSSNATITSCTFAGNAAAGGGGGVASTSASSTTLRNCIIAYSTTGLAVHCDTTSSLTISCSDLYGNIDGDWVGCAAAQDGVSGNFSADPLFCDRPHGDFHLAVNSPCANAPGCGLVGALPAACGAVAVGDPQLDRTRRVILGPSVPNPFRESAEIRYVLTASTDRTLVRFDIYGVDGRLLRRLVNETRDPGVHAVHWDGKDDGGRRLPPGIYFGRIRVGRTAGTVRIVRVE